MGNHHTPVDVDPKAIETAEKAWSNFTKAATFVVASSAVVLLLIAAFLLH